MPRLTSLVPLAAVASVTLAAGCAHDSNARAKADRLVVAGQEVPEFALKANPADFDVPANVVALHYYGSGGWGIWWRGQYILTAPYFSDHSVEWLAASRVSAMAKVVPNVDLIRAGFAGTPVKKTSLILIGHGHVDHAGDVPGFFGPGLITDKPTLIADRSTVNELAAMSDEFGCVAPVDYGARVESARRCPTPGVRITPIHHAHAPHLNLGGIDVAAFGGFVETPRTTLPSRADDYKLGNTWAYLIDLLDEQGNVVFRIHYVDAAASPPHGIDTDPADLKARDVDVSIACVPGFEQSDDYPDAIIRHHNVRYVLAGHWEDFFQPQTEPLKPLRFVLDGQAIDRFVDIVQHDLPHARGVAPLNKDAKACASPNACGPRGEAWAMPVPGETYQFATGPQEKAARLPDPFGAPAP